MAESVGDCRGLGEGTKAGFRFDQPPFTQTLLDYSPAQLADAGFSVIFCIGETLEGLEAGKPA